MSAPPSGALARLAARAASFFALSRTPHAALDLATPAAAALLWLDRFPGAWVVAGGLLTTFAGYTSVYALNDLVDYKVDRKRLALGKADYGDYLDAKILRHPVAQGALSLRAAITWTACWGCIAVAGAFLFNPVCAMIFGVAFLLEGVYCLLAQVTPLRTLVSGAVKTAGPMAAVFAVDPSPDPRHLLLIFSWLFLWEIGGQNIPNDWGDIEQDRTLGFRTLPVRVETTWASRLVLAALGASVVLGVLASRRPTVAGFLGYGAGALAAGTVLLIVPALRLLRTRGRGDALALFNRASYYPLAVLGVVAVKALLRL